MSGTVRAAVLPAYRAELELAEIPVPQPRGGEVLIRVRAAGVCHSDLHLIEGEPPALPRFPWTLGHEVAGEVAALGPAATGVNSCAPSTRGQGPGSAVRAAGSRCR